MLSTRADDDLTDLAEAVGVLRSFTPAFQGVSA